MIFIREINPLSVKLLERYRQSRHHQVQTRAPWLILALPGVKTEEFSKIFRVSYKTIYNGLNCWEVEGMVGGASFFCKNIKRLADH